MDPSYHPELEEASFLCQEGAFKYRSYIGSLNWAITLGRFDIQYAVSNLARYNMSPREGHMEAVIRVVGYLKQVQTKNPMLLVNPVMPERPEYVSHDFDNWKEFYPEASEAILMIS